MKNVFYRYISAVLLAVSVFSLALSCSEKPEEPDEPEIPEQPEDPDKPQDPENPEHPDEAFLKLYTADELSFESSGGRSTIVFEASDTVQVSLSSPVGWSRISSTEFPQGVQNLELEVEANPSPDERNVSVVFRCGELEERVLVVQKQQDALTVSSNRIEMEADGGAVSILVKSNVDYEYVIDPASGWIRPGFTKGLTESSIELFVDPNASVERREGRVTVVSGDLSETVTVFQEGAEPSFVLTQDEFQVSSSGGTIRVELATNSDYRYDIVDSPWIIDASTRGISSYTHDFEVLPNEEYIPRSGYIRFYNLKDGSAHDVTVFQVQKDGLTVSKEELAASADGGVLSFDVLTNLSHSAEIVEGASWLHLLPGTTASEEGLDRHPVQLRVDANEEVEPRRGKIRIKAGDLKAEVAVEQSGAQVQFILSEKEYRFSSEGGAFEVELATNVDYRYEVSDPSWIVAVDTRAVQTHRHRFTVLANEGYVARSGYIRFYNLKDGSAHDVTVFQVQKDGLTVSKEELEASADGGVLSFDVLTNLSYSAEIVEGASWLHLLPETTASEEGLDRHPVQLRVDANEEVEPRRGKVRIKAGDLKEEVAVEQSGAQVQFILSEMEYRFSSEGGTFEVELATNVDYRCEVSDPSWIVSVDTRAVQTHVHRFQVKANEGYVARSGYIRFYNLKDGSAQDVTVYQDRQEGFFVSTERLTVDAEGGRVSFEVRTNLDFSYEIVEGGSWIHRTAVREAEGLTEYRIVLQVDENPGIYSRFGVVALSAGDRSAGVSIEQEGAEPYFTLRQDHFEVGADGGALEVRFETNSRVSFRVSSDWIVPDSDAPVSVASRRFRILDNPAFALRSGVITFVCEADGSEYPVSVRQGVHEDFVRLTMVHTEKRLEHFSWQGLQIVGLVDWGDGMTEFFSPEVTQHDYPDETEKSTVFELRGADIFRLEKLRSVSVIRISLGEDLQ